MSFLSGTRPVLLLSGTRPVSQHTLAPACSLFLFSPFHGLHFPPFAFHLCFFAFAVPFGIFLSFFLSHSFFLLLRVLLVALFCLAWGPLHTAL